MESIRVQIDGPLSAAAVVLLRWKHCRNFGWRRREHHLPPPWSLGGRAPLWKTASGAGRQVSESSAEKQLKSFATYPRKVKNELRKHYYYFLIILLFLKERKKLLAEAEEVVWGVYIQPQSQKTFFFCPFKENQFAQSLDEAAAVVLLLLLQMCGKKNIRAATFPVWRPTREKNKCSFHKHIWMCSIHSRKEKPSWLKLSWTLMRTQR